jgi:hypothetical protein
LPLVPLFQRLQPRLGACQTPDSELEPALALQELLRLAIFLYCPRNLQAPPQGPSAVHCSPINPTRNGTICASCLDCHSFSLGEPGDSNSWSADVHAGTGSCLPRCFEASCGVVMSHLRGHGKAKPASSARIGGRGSCRKQRIRKTELWSHKPGGKGRNCRAGCKQGLPNL